MLCSNPLLQSKMIHLSIYKYINCFKGLGKTETTVSGWRKDFSWMKRHMLRYRVGRQCSGWPTGPGTLASKEGPGRCWRVDRLGRKVLQQQLFRDWRWSTLLEKLVLSTSGFAWKPHRGKWLILCHNLLCWGTWYTSRHYCHLVMDGAAHPLQRWRSSNLCPLWN